MTSPEPHNSKLLWEHHLNGTQLYTLEVRDTTPKSGTYKKITGKYLMTWGVLSPVNLLF